MSHKTAHQLARELLAGPDLPIWHFDPSRAGLDDERDTSLSEPKVEINDPTDGLTDEEIQENKDEGCYTGKFITLCGDCDDAGEATSDDTARLDVLAANSYREGGRGQYAPVYVIASSEVWPVADHELDVQEKRQALRAAIDSMGRVPS